MCVCICVCVFLCGGGGMYGSFQCQPLYVSARGVGGGYVVSHCIQCSGPCFHSLRVIITH